jgi:uncharacterized protein YdhG (YjbR/CyaY superfamily)
MPAPKKQFRTMDEYIKTFPVDVQRILEKIRQTIREAAPGAVETISYQMPTFNIDGEYLIYFAAWKTHIGFYPIPSGDEAFQKRILPYRGKKSSLRFPIKEPIPYDLVKQIVRFRMKENRQKKK